MKRIALLWLLLAFSSAFTKTQAAQDERRLIDVTAIPAGGTAAQDFVPRGWKIEEPIYGDLNNDTLTDIVLKLVEDKPAKDQDDIATERYRALVIIFKDAEQRLTRVAVATKLLYCTRCGGAFWGIVETPSEVTIEQGVIIARHSSGSRELTDTTHRFRYDATVKRFVLIGYDENSYDRLTGEGSSESTNYLTGLKITKKTTYNKKLDKAVEGPAIKSRVAVKKRFIEEMDYEEPPAK